MIAIDGGNSALDALHPIHGHHEALRSAQMNYTGHIRKDGKRINMYENPETPVGASVTYDPKTRKIEHEVEGQHTNALRGKQARSLYSNLIRTEEEEKNSDR